MFALEGTKERLPEFLALGKLLNCRDRRSNQIEWHRKVCHELPIARFASFRNASSLPEAEPLPLLESLELEKRKNI